MKTNSQLQSGFHAAVVAAYLDSPRPLDDLPYTVEFDVLHAELSAMRPGLSKREVLHALTTVRKAGRLPRKNTRSRSAPCLAESDAGALYAAVVGEVGSIGARDRLPYTDSFDRVATAFATTTGLVLSNHELWRAIAHLSKTPSDRPLAAFPVRSTPARRRPSTRTTAKRWN